MKGQLYRFISLPYNFRRKQHMTGIPRKQHMHILPNRAQYVAGVLTNQSGYRFSQSHEIVNGAPLLSIQLTNH